VILAQKTSTDPKENYDKENWQKAIALWTNNPTTTTIFHNY